MAETVTRTQRQVLQRMADGAELTEAIPGGWWLENDKIDARIGWSLLRKSMISVEMSSGDTYFIYSINERGRAVLGAPEAGDQE